MMDLLVNQYFHTLIIIQTCYLPAIKEQLAEKITTESLRKKEPFYEREKHDINVYKVTDPKN